MAFTIEQLFEQGAHHTVEQLVIEGNATIANIIDRLSRRFGPDAVNDPAVIGDLRGRVIGSVNIGEALERGITPLPGEYTVNPAAIDAFEYTVIAEIPDATRPGSTVTIPWTIRSDVPLSGQEVLEQAGRELSQGVPPPDTLVGARGADLTRRRIRFQESVIRGGLGQEDITISIIGGFRRG